MNHFCYKLLNSSFPFSFFFTSFFFFFLISVHNTLAHVSGCKWQCHRNLSRCGLLLTHSPRQKCPFYNNPEIPMKRYCQTWHLALWWTCHALLWVLPSSLLIRSQVNVTLSHRSALGTGQGNTIRCILQRHLPHPPPRAKLGYHCEEGLSYVRKNDSEKDLPVKDQEGMYVSPALTLGFQEEKTKTNSGHFCLTLSPHDFVFRQLGVLCHFYGSEISLHLWFLGQALAQHSYHFSVPDLIFSVPPNSICQQIVSAAREAAPWAHAVHRIPLWYKLLIKFARPAAAARFLPSRKAAGKAFYQPPAPTVRALPRRALPRRASR